MYVVFITPHKGLSIDISDIISNFNFCWDDWRRGLWATHFISSKSLFDNWIIWNFELSDKLTKGCTATPLDFSLEYPFLNFLSKSLYFSIFFFFLPNLGRLRSSQITQPYFFFCLTVLSSIMPFLSYFMTNIKKINRLHHQHFAWKYSRLNIHCL